MNTSALCLFTQQDCCFTLHKLNLVSGNKRDVKQFLKDGLDVIKQNFALTRNKTSIHYFKSYKVMEGITLHERDKYKDNGKYLIEADGSYLEVLPVSKQLGIVKSALENRMVCTTLHFKFRTINSNYSVEDVVKSLGLNCNSTDKTRVIGNKSFRTGKVFIDGNVITGANIGSALSKVYICVYNPMTKHGIDSAVDWELRSNDKGMNNKILYKAVINCVMSGDNENVAVFNSVMCSYLE